MKVCGECPSATSSKDPPWYGVPADNKDHARLIVSQIFIDTFGGLDMAHPVASAERVRQPKAIREQLAG